MAKAAPLIGGWSVRVIGVGFGRTGTMSLKLALEELGFGPCYHMMEVIGHRDRIGHWRAVAEGQPIGWDQVFAGYQSTVDWPAAACWRQLVDAYPEARVILTVRDPDRWYESASSTIFRNMLRADRPVGRLLGLLSLVGDPSMLRFIPVAQKLIATGVFDDRLADRGYAIEVFQRHIREVQEYVPAERLLVYQVGDGWEPLCEFLGTEVPATPFPRVNTAEETRRFLRRPIVRGAAIAGVAATALVGLGAALAYCRARP